MDNNSTNSSLAEVYNFSGEDLEYNRQKQLSPAQRYKLQKYLLAGQILILIFFVAAILSNLYIIFAAIVQHRAALPFIILSVLLAGVWESLRRALSVPMKVLRNALDGANPLIRTAEGTPNIQYLDKIARVTIAGEPFNIYSKDAGIFEPEKSYRIYYVPGTPIVLSAEALA